MEPTYKRRCIPRNDDPNAEFHERRARNDQRLKSTFEAIFEKYGKDFSGIADEIDLRTGEIIVNRGHVLGLKDETDPGCEDDLYDELNSDDQPETLDRQGKADLLGLDPDNSLNDFTASASEAPCYSEPGNDSLTGNIDEKLSSIEPELSVRKDFRGRHRDQSFRTGPRAAENGGSKLSWKSRLQPHPSNVTISPQRSLGPSFNDGQAAVELAWRAPPLPKRVASVQQAVSGSLFNPHQREHERFASPPDASLWAPETSNIYSERPRSRRKKNSSTRRLKSLAVARPPTLGKDFPVANVTSLDYEWSKISVRSRPEETIEKNVPLTLPDSSIALDSTNATTWTPGEDQLLHFLKSVRMPYSKMVVYYPIRTEVDLEDRWFELHGLNNKPLSLEDDEPRTLDQRTTTSHNKDRQTSHYNSLPTLPSHVPDDHYSSTDPRGDQDLVLPKIPKSDMCETRYFGPEKQPQSLELKRFRRKFGCYSYSQMPIRRPSSISHDAQAPDTSSVVVSQSQVRSNKTSRLQTMNKEAPRPAKSTTVPISPYDNLSDDELSMSAPTVGTYCNNAKQTHNAFLPCSTQADFPCMKLTRD